MLEITTQMLIAFDAELEKTAVGAAAIAKALKGAGKKGMDMASRFAKRQRHSVTGWTPKGADKVTALREMGAGAAPALQRLEDARAAVSSGGKGALRELASAEKHLKAAKEVEGLGATNVPGFLKSLSKNPTQTLSASAREAWHGSGSGIPGAAGKAMTFGLPGAAVAGEALRASEKGEKGRAERTGRALGGLALGMTSMPITGATILGTGLTAGAGLAGRGLGKLKKRKEAGLASATEDEDEEDRTGPVERVESNASQGKAPEGFGS